MTSDLHARLTAAIDAREALARAADAVFAGIEVPESWPEAVADFADAFNPAAALAGIAEDRDILARHAPKPLPFNGPSECAFCELHSSDPWITDIVDRRDWPCPEVLSLARRLRIEVDHG